MERPTPPHPDEQGLGPYRLRWWAMPVLSFAILITTLDATIVNVALPSIAADLHASNSDLQWIVDAYLIVLAGLVLFGEGLADRYGRREVFLAGLALFGLGSVFATLAGSPSALIGARAVMGLGAALLMPPALSIMAVIFPPEERPRAIAIWAGVAGAGIALGPVLGGFLLDRFWWGSVFLVNVPVTLIGIAATLILVPTSRRPGAPRLDLVGAALSVTGLATFLYGVIEGPDQGWTAPLVLGGLVVGAVLVACFVLWELRSRAPMFDVRVFLRRAVVGGGLAIFAVYMTFFGIVYLTPQYLQYVEGHSTLEVGVLMLPLGLVFALLSPFSAELSRRIGVRRVLTGGLVVMAAGLALLALVRDIAGSGVVLAGTAVYSVGWAAMMAPATTAIVNALPAAKAGDASSVNQITRQAGGAFGIAVIGSVFAAIYVGGVRAALPAEIAPAAERSIGSALEAAARHGGASSERLVEQATLAFDAAAQVAFLVAAGLALAGAAAAAIALRRS